MCGIVGILEFSKDEINAELLIKMRDTMVHRGPDGSGIWISPSKKVGFGHRRLSILDLSDDAAQPMSNAAQTIWVTFNGEIYNYLEIRKELEEIGSYEWKSKNSDTEVIVHAFEEWGIDCVYKLRGMFSIGIWDELKKELWLIRDRIGEKPLYYSFYQEKLSFASEIKAILTDPKISRSVNEEALFHYLSFLTSPAPLTLFEGINKLPPATWMKVSEFGDCELFNYWDPLDHLVNLENKSESELADKLLNELTNSVNLRKASDVPIGIFLSGGIDSSTNVALFSNNEKEGVKTFSIGYAGEYGTYQNELDYAKLVADTFGAKYHERRLTQNDLIKFLPEMVRLQDEPIADPVCVPVYYVSKLARDNGVIVCQVGEGADELFFGYTNWKLILSLQTADTLPVPKVVKIVCMTILKAAGKENSKPYEWLRRGSLGLPIFWGGAEAFTHTHKMKVLSPRMRDKFQERSSWEVIRPFWERFSLRSKEGPFINWMTYLDLMYRLPELLLMRVDKMAMGASVEGRVPFLDHKFIEYAMSIPSKLKFKNNILKYILKKAVRGVIPDEIIDRPKQGFGVPIYEWFNEELGEKALAELKTFCDKTDYLSYDEILKIKKSGNGALLWYLFNFALWWNEYINEDKLKLEK